MIFSILNSPALHNQMHKSQGKKSWKFIIITYCARTLVPGDLEGVGDRSACLGGPYHQPERGRAWILRGGGGGPPPPISIMGITYFKSSLSHPTPLAPPSPQAPPRSVVAFVIVIWPLFAKRFHCLLSSPGACMNRSQQDAGWHHFGQGGVWKSCICDFFGRRRRVGGLPFFHAFSWPVERMS